MGNSSRLDGMFFSAVASQDFKRVLTLTKRVLKKLKQTKQETEDRYDFFSVVKVLQKKERAALERNLSVTK